MQAIFVGLAILASALDANDSASLQKLYVANSAGNDLHVIDTATNRVIGRIEVGPQPHGLAATAAGDLLFITIENTAGDSGELLWFDPRAHKVTRRLSIGPRPNQLACTPDGRLACVPCDDASWWIIDTVRGEVVSKIATGGRPHNTLSSPDGRRMYLGPKGSYHVLIADWRDSPLRRASADRPRARREAALRQRRHADRLRGL